MGGDRSDNDRNMFERIKKTLRNIRRIEDVETLAASLSLELDALRSKLDVGEELLERFRRERMSEAYQAVYRKPDPKVSVCIVTYNRGRLLTERCLPTVLGQTYRNLEVIVVGDCCTDDTSARMSALADPRLTFINLPERGAYPEEPELRWMVAGTTPMNHALGISTGDLVTHLDDDDEFAPDRVRKLVGCIQESRADLVYHPFWSQTNAGGWGLNKAERLGKGQVTTSSILYHRWLNNIPWDINAYRYREPGDWNRLRKLLYIGAKAVRYPEPLLKHYRERNQGS